MCVTINNIMKYSLFFLGLLTVCCGRKLQDLVEIYDDNDRYFYFPGDGDGLIHIVDMEEDVDVNFIEEFARRPKSDSYWLFTRRNPTVPDILIEGDAESIFISNFNSYKEVVFLVHGWYGNGVNNMNIMLTEAFLKKGDVNVVVLDWSALATKNYVTAKRGVSFLGERLGDFIKWLNTFGADYNRIHLVGFSLGAHVVGSAGRTTGGLIKRITGLDPAGPLWKRDDNKLRRTDAQYVEVIHTNTELYGLLESCGDADFYPNGGSKMPGCWLNVCSHSKGYEYMAATIIHNHLIGNECEDVEHASSDECYGETYPMGNSDLTKSRPGIFRVNTRKRFPF